MGGGAVGEYFNEVCLCKENQLRAGAGREVFVALGRSDELLVALGGGNMCSRLGVIYGTCGEVGVDEEMRWGPDEMEIPGK
jgi:hypothetical protein